MEVSFLAPPSHLVSVRVACTQGQGLLKDPGVLCEHSLGSALFSVTASFSATHGPSQGDNKLCNCRIKQWRKGRDKLDVSLGLKCEHADLSYLTEEGL